MPCATYIIHTHTQIMYIITKHTCATYLMHTTSIQTIHYIHGLPTMHNMRNKHSMPEMHLTLYVAHGINYIHDIGLGNVVSEI